MRGERQGRRASANFPSSIAGYTRDYTAELLLRWTRSAGRGGVGRRGTGGAVLYIFLPFRPCLTRKKSTFINLLRDICAHNFRDPAIKLQAQTPGARCWIHHFLQALFAVWFCPIISLQHGPDPDTWKHSRRPQQDIYTIHTSSIPIYIYRLQYLQRLRA